MNENINIVPLRQPDEIDDPLTNILRSGARQLLAQAVENEAAAFLDAMKDLKLADGRDRLVRHGHGPTRTIQTGIGRAHWDKPKPLIEPGMSMSVKSTSTWMSSFWRITSASSELHGSCPSNGSQVAGLRRLIHLTMSSG